MSIQRFGGNQRLSEAVIAGGLVFLAGQVPSNVQADMRGQTANVLTQIDQLLQECGTDKSKLVDALIFLPDLNDYAALNDVWDAWVPEGCAPSRACIQAALANPEWKVEIKVVAAL